MGDGRYDVEGQWWVLWPLDRLVADNLAGWKDPELTLRVDLIAIGDDGTGNPFCVPASGEDEDVRWNWIDCDVELEQGSLAAFSATWLT